MQYWSVNFHKDLYLEPSKYLDPKVCKVMALMAVIWGLGLLFYILFKV